MKSLLCHFVQSGLKDMLLFYFPQVFLLLFAFSPFCRVSAETIDPQYAWIQLVPTRQQEDALEVRALVQKGHSCPRVFVDDYEHPMHVRKDRSFYFPVQLCYWPLHHYAHVRIGRFFWTEHLIQRVVILSPLSHFLSVSVRQKLVSSVRDARPDLVVFLGNYMQPNQNGWANWRKNFFDLFQPLFSMAPVVFARGSSEATMTPNRQGWYAFLTHSLTQQKGSWLAHCSHFHAIILDSFSAGHSTKGSQKLFSETERLDAETLNPHPWIITPSPLFCVKRFFIFDKPFCHNQLRSFFEGWVTRKSSLVISSEGRNSAIMQFDGLPLQLVLEEKAKREKGDVLFSPLSPQDLTLRKVFAHSGISFAIFDYQPSIFENSQWILTWVDLLFRPIEKCVLKVRDLSCHGSFYGF